jgi:hypothetical protein
MNIIKFRDIILDERNNTYSLSEDKVELFNNKLRGRYAYAVNFVHIIPLEDITQKQYYEISVDESKLDGITYIELIDVKDFIDIEETRKLNPGLPEDPNEWPAYTQPIRTWVVRCSNPNCICCRRN